MTFQNVQKVRVKHPLLGEFNVRRPYGDLTEIDKPATHPGGEEIPAKPKTTVAKKAAATAKKADPTPNGGEPASDPKEGSIS
jgi:hypothetical protein